MHLLLTASSAPATLTATASQTILPMREQLPHQSTRNLNAPKAPGQSGLIQSQWTRELFELEMHLRIKAEELPGGTELQQRTARIREELRKCTFLERIKENVLFRNRKI